MFAKSLMFIVMWTPCHSAPSLRNTGINRLTRFNVEDKHDTPFALPQLITCFQINCSTHSASYWVHTGFVSPIAKNKRSDVR
ncbi:hypothetical protein LZ32DRAFT_387785 [Colletotrichum eremochloae]|nr:hypothetical protein LZ32DRAFT_387785 [Colletotrichum eremochloae]